MTFFPLRYRNACTSGILFLDSTSPHCHATCGTLSRVEFLGGCDTPCAGAGLPSKRGSDLVLLIGMPDHILSPGVSSRKKFFSTFPAGPYGEHSHF
jgi:hypothetical protein